LNSAPNFLRNVSDEDLIVAAKAAMANAYSPYSHLKVGAACLWNDGKIYTGCNIENTVFPATLCAERAGISTAVTQGATRLDKVAIASSAKEPLLPCGICLQTMTEFARDQNLKIVSVGANGRVVRSTLGELLPSGVNVKKAIRSVTD
jgi:cytidine deaminase